MKKLFISQPMRDKTNDEIERERKEARIKAEVTIGEVEILDSFFKDAPHDAKPLWYLGEAIKLLGNGQKALYTQKDIDLTSKEAVKQADRERFEFVNNIVKVVETRKTFTKENNLSKCGRGRRK